ncbi:ABC transporter permease subunit [Streptomyces zingiberis]|nr:ABC transporter permease [Streptomyces zingiberis]
MPAAAAPYGAPGAPEGPPHQPSAQGAQGAPGAQQFGAPHPHYRPPHPQQAPHQVQAQTQPPAQPQSGYGHPQPAASVPQPGGAPQPHAQAPVPPPSGYGHPQQATAQQVPSGQPGYGHPHQGQGAGQASPAAMGYRSPIPVRNTHLGHALAAEWTKIRTVRSTVWTLTVMAVLVLGIGFLVNNFTETSDYDANPPIMNGLFGLILGQICVVTLGVLVISSEYGTGLIRTTLTAAPRRSRVLTAKVLVFLAVSWTVTTVVCALTALMGTAMHNGPGVAEATASEWAGATVWAGLYVALLGVLAMAVGAMLRHSAGAITAMLGVVLLPAILPAFMMFSESMRPAAEKILEYNAINSLAALHQVTGDGDGMSQLLLLAGVTAVALAGAYTLLERRDV